MLQGPTLPAQASSCRHAPAFYLEAALASLDKLISLNPTALYFSHFGKATEAVQRLNDYKVQLQLWADIAEDGVKKIKI